MFETILVMTAFWCAAGYTTDMYLKQHELDIKEEEAKQEIEIDYLHCRFVELFEKIYNKSMFSTQRVVASIASTAIGLIIVMWAIGPENSRVIGDFLNSRNIDWDLAGIVVLINFIPDFFSLEETRLVLKFSQKNRRKLPFLTLDILLTSLIFFVGMTIAGFIFSGNIPSFERTIDIMFDIDQALIFFLTTFFTSFVWFMFLISCLIIKTAHSNVAFFRSLIGVATSSNTIGRVLAIFYSIVSGIIVFLGFYAKGLVSG